MLTGVEMKTTVLTAKEVLKGYDIVSVLYPYVPLLSHWRAWEYAAYKKFRLKGRILDVGCGDGRYFQLVFPNLKDVVGIDMDQTVVDLARKSGIYRIVHTAPAHKVPETNETFDHVFANCSLEHMDCLDEVLSEIYRCLKPGGSLICSVVTDYFVRWSLLHNLISIAGYDDVATVLQKDYIDYHHLRNPLSVSNWSRKFSKAGLLVEEHIPILPKFNSGLFLLTDGLWHVKRACGGEIGEIIFPYFSINKKFPKGFRQIISGLLDMETNWQECSGAVFKVRREK